MMRQMRTKAVLILVLATAFIAAAESPSRIPAFPGAEGAGKWAKGGRGGRVLRVTNLDDAGPGSLRAAVEAKGPRTVVFDVSGTIALKSALSIKQPFITIAGQTAPGAGICLKGHGLYVSNTHDVIIRHLRCRPGDQALKPGEVDAISLTNARDVILDHCSATWSTDECLSITRDSDRVTVQHCLIAEALTSHSLGSIIGSYEGSISFLHNLFASNRGRNPRLSGYQAEAGRGGTAGPRVDFRHNVIFNWYSGPGYTGTAKPDAPERVAFNLVGNHYKPGPDTLASQRGLIFTLHEGATVEAYLAGNVNEAAPSAAQADMLRIKPGVNLTLRETPVPHEPLERTLTAAEAYASVLQNAGATLPRRDAVDTRIIAGVKDGSGRQIATIPVNAWPELRSAAPWTDRDGDGLPDAWERTHGLDPDDGTDAAHAASSEGWTHLELWLNSPHP